MKKVVESIGYIVIGFIILYLLGSFMNWAACSGHNRDWVGMFKEKFGRVNDEALATAACNDPQFLAQFISFGEIKNITKAMAIISLGEVYNPDYYGMLRTYTRDKSPLIREAAYRSLSFYYFEDEVKKYNGLLQEFKDALEQEEAPGVRKRLKSLIDLMKKYEGVEPGDWDDKYETKSSK